jgi:hypothetical protein
VNQHVLEDLGHEMWLDPPTTEPKAHRWLWKAYQRGLNGDGLTPAELREQAIKYLIRATELEERERLAQEAAQEPKPAVKGLPVLMTHQGPIDASDYASGAQRQGFSGFTYQVVGGPEEPKYWVRQS